jgi:hypothetical protein
MYDLGVPNLFIHIVFKILIENKDSGPEVTHIFHSFL